MSEVAGGVRIECGILNPCQRNKLGVPRLEDCLDPNERRDFISLRNGEVVISEGKAEAAKNAAASGHVDGATGVQKKGEHTQPTFCKRTMSGVRFCVRGDIVLVRWTSSDDGFCRLRQNTNCGRWKSAILTGSKRLEPGAYS